MKVQAKKKNTLQEYEINTNTIYLHMQQEYYLNTIYIYFLMAKFNVYICCDVYHTGIRLKKNMKIFIILFLGLF